MRGLQKLLLVVLAVSVMLMGCGTSPESYAKEQYSLVDVQGSGSTMQKVYKAANQSVPQVAQHLADQDRPEEMSAPNDERMFLVYPDQVIHVQQDPENKQDTLVEIDSMQFVREHYDPGFLEPFLAGAVLGHIFGNNWRYSPNYGAGYHGYGYSRYGGYKPPSTPSKPPGTIVTPPKSSGGSGTVIPRNGGGGYTTTPPSTGGNRAPPSGGGGYSTPPKSGGGFSTPPRSSGGRGGVVRRR